MSVKSTVRDLLRRNGPRTAPELTFADYVAERVSIWSEAPAVPSALVFLGDSQMERGRWNEWWTHTPILNRGIGGETIDGVTARLDEIVRHAPPLIVLECGANNLAAGALPEVAAREYADLLGALSTRLPKCIVWVQGVLPVNPVQWRDLPPAESATRAQEMNAQVRALNSQIEVLAQKQGAFYLDLHLFFEIGGVLRPECTLDGLHLNGVGYRVWREALQRQAPPQVAALLNSPSQ